MSATDYGLDDLMVVAAFRYCMGRRTYMVGYCSDWLIRIWPAISERARFIIKRDLEDEFKRDDESRERNGDDAWHPLGYDFDRAEWNKVRALWAGEMAE